MPPSARHDVIIVGGGVMGLFIAARLAARGVRPLLLERRHLGAGSTGKSGAIIRQHYSLELTAAMARDSLRVFSAFEADLGGSAGFVQTGMAVIVAGKDRSSLAQNIAMQRGLGIATELLDAAQLREAVPGAAVDVDVAGCFERDAGHADPLRTVHTLAAAVRRLGGEIREGVEVTGFTGTPSRVNGVSTAGGDIGAERVVVAAGPWAGRVMRMVGWQANVQPMRVQCAVFRRPPAYSGGPVIIDFPNEVYAKHTAETHVGSIAPGETEAVDPDDYNEGVERAYVALARTRISRRLTPMNAAISFGGYGALYAVTPDWHPVVGPAGPDGIYLCAGFSGHGFKLSPSVGATVAAELLDDTPPYDFTILRPDRFQRGEKVSGRYAYSIVG